jgi:hypothetical protein
MGEMNAWKVWTGKRERKRILLGVYGSIILK